MNVSTRKDVSKMANLYILDPEVAGGFGPQTQISNLHELETGSDIMPNVTQLEYQFDGWMGDDIIQSVPAFAVTHRLAETLRNANVTGAHFESIQVSFSSAWQQTCANTVLPDFLRMMPQGRAEVDHSDRVVCWSRHDIGFAYYLGWTKPDSPEQFLNMRPPYMLYVSEKVMDILARFNISQCDVSTLGPVDDVDECSALTYQS